MIVGAAQYLCSERVSALISMVYWSGLRMAQNASKCETEDLYAKGLSVNKILHNLTFLD